MDAPHVPTVPGCRVKWKLLTVCSHVRCMMLTLHLACPRSSLGIGVGGGECPRMPSAVLFFTVRPLRRPDISVPMVRASTMRSCDPRQPPAAAWLHMLRTEISRARAGRQLHGSSLLFAPWALQARKGYQRLHEGVADMLMG